MSETQFQPTTIKPPPPSKGMMWLLGAAAIGILTVANLPAETNIPWLDDLGEAQAVSYEEKRPVLLAFTGAGCVFCRRMDREVFTQPEVEEAIKKFVPVRIDWSTDRDLAMRYGVEGIPAFLVLKTNGKPVLRTSGFVPAEVFTSFLSEAAVRAAAADDR